MYAQATTAYKTTNAMAADPNKLILMLYEGGIKFLLLTRKGIYENNKVMRGENLHKVIGIVTELLSSVNGDTEQAVFLRGLYSSMLSELAKVNITNDAGIVEISIKYLAQLKNIWEQEVMAKPAYAHSDVAVEEKDSNTQQDSKAKEQDYNYGARSAGSSMAYTYACR